MTAKRQYTLAAPVHPGGFIKRQVLPNYGLTIVKAAEVLGVNRANFNNVLNARAALTPDLALKVEEAFGVPARVMLAMQGTYSLWEAESRRDEVVAGVKKQQPVEQYA